jgi:methylisocitrate lyase
VNASVKTAWPGDLLRELLGRPAILEQPAVCDPFSARLARDAGYQAVTLPGYAIGAHLPLTCELSLDDIERAARAVIRAAGLPVLLDADVGWGGTEQLPAAVARLEAAGVAAIEVSSQHVPDQAPFSPALERRRAQASLLRRVADARAARDHLLIMARCDVTPGRGYDDVLDRARGLLAAGADAILVHGAGDGLRRLPRDLPGATLIYTGPASAASGPSAFPAPVLERWGYRALTPKYHRCYCSRRSRQVPDLDCPAVVPRPS